MSETLSHKNGKKSQGESFYSLGDVDGVGPAVVEMMEQLRWGVKATVAAYAHGCELCY